MHTSLIKETPRDKPQAHVKIKREIFMYTYKYVPSGN